MVPALPKQGGIAPTGETQWNPNGFSWQRTSQTMLLHQTTQQRMEISCPEKENTT